MIVKIGQSLFAVLNFSWISDMSLAAVLQCLENTDIDMIGTRLV